MALLDMRAGKRGKEQGYGDNDVDADTDLVGKISMGKGASATIQRLAIQVSSGFPSVQLCGD